MKKILVLGYLNKNLGDDLFFKILFERYKNVEWYFVDVDEQHISPFINLNVKTISNKDFLLSFYKYDGLVNIGGSIFIQNKRWLLQFIKRLYYTIPLKLLRKKVIIIGANFGPFKGKLFKYIYASYFKLIDFVSFRDKKSFLLFKGNKKVKKASDIVFSLKIKRNNSIKNVIGISLMDFSWREGSKENHDNYLKSMINLTDWLLKKDYNVKLFSFCENEGDHAISRILLDKFKDKNISSIDYNGDIDRFLEEYSMVSGHVCLRFHSVILSILLRIPFYPIIYSGKTLNLLEDLYGDTDFINVKEIQKLNPENVMENLFLKDINLEGIIKDSNNHFKLLDNFLGEKRIGEK
ncbi:polysaccharide pyruvyl transferase family protein [Peribacillus frigoritolerans]|uniref:polysaccharide pyruvyl transferase family protein n=1 Tax=Peribacillus frigoritolerans TaxID=450367 RepID=UPI0010707838|nr:polysaccharide pyruvyl transferase family protein [Peribacillus frigoritolerans]TFH63643.1 polysaccharide pyruvyl transferase family protein [Peribacillus frigoritolerans]